MKNLVQIVESTNKESKQVEQILAKIHKDCKPYIQHLNKNKAHFYRGMRDKDVAGIKTRREDRKPLNTNPIFDKLVNLALEEGGAIPRSKGIFTKIKDYGVGEFGSPYYIFPKGKFEFYYLDGINDLTYDYAIGTQSEELQVLPKPFIIVLKMLVMTSKSTEHFMSRLEDAVIDYNEDNEDFEWDYRDELDDLRRKCEKLIDIKNDVVNNKLPRNRNAEVVLNVDQYYYVSVKHIDLMLDSLIDKDRDLFIF